MIVVTKMVTDAEKGKATSTRMKGHLTRTINQLNNAMKAKDVKQPEVEKEDSVKKAIASATRTERGDNKYQGSACVICDRLIKEVETVQKINKARIQMHSHRLSVKTYATFYNGDTLNPTLARQYSVDGLPAHLLSPRSYQSNGNDFGLCLT